MFEKLTKYIEPIEAGQFFMERAAGGYKEYSDTAQDLMDEIYDFVDDHPELNLTDYGTPLEDAGIEYSLDSFEAVEIEKQAQSVVLAMLIGLLRAERLYEGTWNTAYESGILVRLLKRLEEFDGEA